jgi:hypothetical protein
MYGGEIAVNHLAPEAPQTELDAPCTNQHSACDGSVIHAWHTGERFNKFTYRSAAARPQMEDLMDEVRRNAGGDVGKFMQRAGNYAQWVATATIKGATKPDALFPLNVCGDVKSN